MLIIERYVFNIFVIELEFMLKKKLWRTFENLHNNYFQNLDFLNMFLKEMSYP